MRNVIEWIGFNGTTDSNKVNKIEVIVLDDQKSRELFIGCLFVQLYDIVNIHANAYMAKEGTNS